MLESSCQIPGAQPDRRVLQKLPLDGIVSFAQIHAETSGGYIVFSYFFL